MSASAPPPLQYTTGDIEAASGVLCAAATRLIERGEPLWPLETLSPSRLLRYYPQPSWRVAWRAGQAVGTYSLLKADPYFWPDDPPGQALYLHKLGVHPVAQGQGLAHDLLQYAAEEARQSGRPYLRLDTAVDRHKLRQLYRTCGFDEVDEVRVGPYLVVRMQRII